MCLAHTVSCRHSSMVVSTFEGDLFIAGPRGGESTMSMHLAVSASVLALAGLLGTQAQAQNAEIDTYQLVRRDGSHVVATGIFNGIDAEFITLGRWRIPRSHVRFLCFGACPQELP